MKEDMRFGIIAYVLSGLEKKYWYFGKIVVQKIIYFLQEAENVDFGYRFVFYHYGPYSEQLSRDLQLMQAEEVLQSGLDPKGMGYSISVNKVNARTLFEKTKLPNSLKDIKKKINSILEGLPGYGPPKLELLSAIHFVFKNIRRESDSSRIKTKVIRAVKKMKPKFSFEQINELYYRLEEMGYLG